MSTLKPRTENGRIFPLPERSIAGNPTPMIQGAAVKASCPLGQLGSSRLNWLHYQCQGKSAMSNPSKNNTSRRASIRPRCVLLDECLPREFRACLKPHWSTSVLDLAYLPGRKQESKMAGGSQAIRSEDCRSRASDQTWRGCPHLLSSENALFSTTE